MKGKKNNNSFSITETDTTGVAQLPHGNRKDEAPRNEKMVLLDMNADIENTMKCVLHT